MSGTKSWMIAGAVAGLLAARAAGAAEVSEDEARAARGPQPAEQVRSYGGASEGTGSSAAGAGAGETGAAAEFRGAEQERARPAAAETSAEAAARRDAEQVAAGNTGGRG
jgi:hypothetical protein